MKKPEQASVTQSPTAVPSAPSRRTRGAERDVDPYLAVVGRRIREIRTEQSLTQAELAVKAGLQVTTIFSVENGLQYLTLKTLLGIDPAAWWRPTAANFFDKVTKPVMFEALEQIDGPALATRYASAKKADLAATCERICAGDFIGEVGTKAAARAWLPAVSCSQRQNAAAEARPWASRSAKRTT